MFDIVCLRKKVQKHQAELQTREWDFCAVAEELKRIPDSASLEEKWTAYTCSRLRAMRFVTDDGEPLVGRLRFDPHTEEEKKAAEDYLENGSFLKDCPHVGQTGHCEPNYDEIFALGIKGLIERISKLEATASTKQKITYWSFMAVLEAMRDMIAQAAKDAGCEEAAERCRHLMNDAPRTFLEALQMMWFVDIAIMAGEGPALVGPGRIDKRLGKFYDADLAAGRITYEAAVQNIALVYLYINDYTYSSLAYGVMVGGEEVNALSYACIDAIRISRLTYPSVGICANKNTPRDLKRLATEVISEGYPNPSFFNDAVIRKGLEFYGIPKKESGDYINSTCVEITPCGASNVWVASPYYNLCGIMLDTLKTKYDNFEAFLDGFLDNLAKKVRVGANCQNEYRKQRNSNRRRPLQSVFTRDCIGRGLDIEDGGAKYNWVECSFVGLANLVDSLTVLRNEVFCEGGMTQEQMCKLLESNFEGNEAIRLKFLNRYPKYGHDDASVDGLIKPIIAAIRRECNEMKMFPGDSLYIPGTFCWVMHQRLGSETGATPDGRVAGFPFADGAGPAQGREKYGPTTAVKSVCSWDHSMLVGGSAFNMKYSKSLLKSAEEREKLIDLIDAFIAGGGFQTQINVADNEILKKALENPEEYSDLVVRIGGYTDYFVRLDPKMQQEIMMRTQYEAL